MMNRVKKFLKMDEATRILMLCKPLRLFRYNQRDREQQALLESISSQREEIPIWEQLATYQFDPWQVAPRQVFSSAKILSGNHDSSSTDSELF